jgi:hypothetical protein
MYQISNEYLKAWRKKVRKTENSWYFSRSKGHNFVKNQWIKTKLELDLYFGMVKQCTKYQMNIWKHEKKKVRKTENLWYFPKSNGHNSVKNWWIKTKLELDLYLSMAKQCTKYQMNIWKHEQKKCGKLIYRTDGRTDRQSANLKFPPTSSVGD